MHRYFVDTLWHRAALSQEFELLAPPVPARLRSFRPKKASETQPILRSMMSPLWPRRHLNSKTPFERYTTGHDARTDTDGSFHRRTLRKIG